MDFTNKTLSEILILPFNMLLIFLLILLMVLGCLLFIALTATRSVHGDRNNSEQYDLRNYGRRDNSGGNNQMPTQNILNRKNVIGSQSYKNAERVSETNIKDSSVGAVMNSSDKSKPTLKANKIKTNKSRKAK